MTGIENSQTTILLIDDEADVLAGLSKILTSAHYICHTAHTAQSAMELVSRISPDLILSDINLDGESGLELCERIKQREGLKDVPLMFLSGAQIPDIIRRAHAAGGVYYLRKPFDPQVLLELIDKALWMPHLVGTQLARA
jgi:putative two-component system response regulator